MLNKRLLAGIAGALVMGMAVPAMAQQAEQPTATTEATVEVAPTASIWAGDAAVLLTLNGTGAENYAAVQSSLTHLNNTAADISVAIENGALATDLPANLNYWLFRGMDRATAVTKIQADAAASYLDGIFRFTGAAVNTGVATSLFADVAISTNTTTGDVLPVVYAADARNSLPPVADHVTVVTWTIAPDSGGV
jgi:hypothetical protein